MAGPGSAQMAQSQVKWYQATYEIDGHSVRVQYLSDRAMAHSDIANLAAQSAGRAAEHRNDFCRIFVDDVGQGSKAAITSWAEKLRQAEGPASNLANSNASAADKGRFASSRSLETVSRVAGGVGEAFAETGRRVASAILPVPTEEEKALREHAAVVRGGRSRRATVVAETARGETGETETAAIRAEVPSEEAPKAEERTVSGPQEATTITIPKSDLRRNNYEFRIKYDPSRLEPGYTERDLQSVDFFHRPENRDAVISFTYRNLNTKSDWYDELGKPLFHRVFSRLFEVADFVLVNPENKVAQHFAVYIDEEKAERLGIDTSDPMVLINSGVILRILQGAIGNETRWRAGSTEEVIAAWKEFIESQREKGYVMRLRRS